MLIETEKCENYIASLKLERIYIPTCNNSNFNFQIDNEEMLVVNNKEKLHTCNSGLTINVSIVNDLVSDCGPEAENEYLLKALVAGKYSPCVNKWQIPCIEGHPRCYNISEICQHQFNENNHLIPCRTGEHLQNCKMFECNIMFRYPSYYCIPWTYICNGKRDCPHGHDELHCSHFSNHFFKTNNQAICIHLSEICDGKVDCLQGHDEYFCSLKH